MRAIKRTKSTRGPKSRTFPQLNVSKTADTLGISRSHLVRLLNGECRPSLRTAQMLARVLGWSIGKIADLYRKDLLRCPNSHCGQRWKPEDRRKYNDHLRTCRYGEGK